MDVSSSLFYLAERSSELFFVFDLKTSEFQYMNPRCLEFFDLESIDVDAKLLFDKIHPDDQEYVLTNLRNCIDGQTVADVECRVLRGNYERFLSITPFFINEEGDRLLIGQAEDITAYKAYIEVLNSHNSKKNSILTILAHDLAGPIGTIGNLSTMLGQETAELKNPRVDRYIGMIQRISKTSTNMIHDFIGKEFLESSGVELFTKRVEITSKIKGATENLLAMQDELHIQFSFQASTDIIYATIDEDKFLQVINNLISNSLKFTPEGGRIEVFVQENPADVVISVADTGIGIPPQLHPALFDKFSKARRSGLKGEPSTGLGMYIIKTIVGWHHGEIWFDTAENKGTTFYIRIPKA
jgi:two-component system sensor histidine kinase VicK